MRPPLGRSASRGRQSGRQTRDAVAGQTRALSIGRGPGPPTGSPGPDEPFAGLDPVGRGRHERGAGRASRIRRHGAVLSSHQLDLVRTSAKTLSSSTAAGWWPRATSRELRRGGRPRLAVRVAGDPEGHWARRLRLAGRRRFRCRPAPSFSRWSRRRRPGRSGGGPRGRAGGALRFERRRLSEVFREAVGARLEDVNAEAGRSPRRPATQKGEHDEPGLVETDMAGRAARAPSGARARSFRVVTVILVLAVAAAVVIPAVVTAPHGREGRHRRRSPAAMTRTVADAAAHRRRYGQIVRLSDIASAQTSFARAPLAAVLIADSQVLVKQAPSSASGVPRWPEPWLRSADSRVCSLWCPGRSAARAEPRSELADPRLKPAAPNPDRPG